MVAGVPEGEDERRRDEHERDDAQRLDEVGEEGLFRREGVACVSRADAIEASQGGD